MDIKLIKINDIIIKRNFKKTLPKKNKYKKHKKYYNKHGYFYNPIVLDKNNVLLDGYCNYLICKNKNIKNIACVIYDLKKYRKSKLDYDRNKFIKIKSKTNRRIYNIRKHLFEEYHHKCCGCGIDLQIDNPKLDNYLTIDHILPKSKRGKNNINNYQPMCRKCNLEKGDNIVEN